MIIRNEWTKEEIIKALMDASESFCDDCIGKEDCIDYQDMVDGEIPVIIGCGDIQTGGVK